MTDWIDAHRVADLLRPGMTVFVAGATAEPAGILAALAAEGSRAEGVRFVSVFLPGVNEFDLSALHERARCTAFFATGGNRAALAAGRIDFLPLGYRAIYDYLEHGPPIDVALVQVPPADAGRPVGLGLCADFLPAVIDRAGTVVGEVNRRQPTVADSFELAAGRLDYAVECQRALPELPAPAPSERDAALGRHVAELVADGSCLQVGLGRAPAVVLAALGGKNDLGCHSGMITDGIMHLAQAGNLTGRCKELDPGRIVTGVVLGSEALYRWAGEAPELRVRPVAYTHDPGTIARLGKLVSINTALQVDLFGQVNAESLDGRQVSGPGGAPDMMRGAALSPGGKSIVVLGATAAGGSRSRIVAALDARTAATSARSDIDYVVTEFGARRVRHLPVAERARALIEIAHPDFRPQLSEEWRELQAR
ncbi:MAG: acetyl-CoA hydrolase [Xanthomonadales bacterium]|nr:acetyl-CoA hydrolase [Xanthomonadales bacterium]NIN59774.1 acetyl-CoA hydrolase [Xanthomonadales bacterium]NIN75149.1 acetyl-CoA hydrolase [Xanthomonadales bacterium]NIO12735.1 acetyl-CoA hydrolase [Xanthomonadales bacterium]NIP12167.1 acetyl-CoA hydrolase [Xanthomonadales bacterium]